MTLNSAAKFDASRAGEYARQSRIALAGYDACHELSACMLSACLGEGTRKHILVVGAGGTAGEIITAATLEQLWSFVAVDPSQPMLELARTNIDEAGIADQVKIVSGSVSDLNAALLFDAAVMIGVLHHLPGVEAKHEILAETAMRLKPGSPLIVAGNYRAYASQPLLMAGWANRWRMNGADAEEIQTKMNKILHGAEPPPSEEAVFELLNAAGFKDPICFFSSLFWGAWLTQRNHY
ncbi:class I SAM-dependent methyltransferase [Klebsiella variicola]|uniref:class I SAM-dependent methyltransferase n=1 Tax=Klebsiella variicola TaxID=244366 RepID=UPI000E2E012D|nr:class I SAM-dependent methyltransferase [Klebsiella variicola]SXF65321.1 3-demethylubiquinone-9 3-O-methyltransferase [Klebsiella variicola]SXF79766.1 3-demethylubiquinone-9 3-O-methyltransferase [Klebsiella variicola]